MINVAQRYQAEQYDGTNGAALVQMLGATPLADDGQVLRFSILYAPGYLFEYEVAVGLWLVWQDWGKVWIVGTFTEADMRQRYVQVGA